MWEVYTHQAGLPSAQFKVSKTFLHIFSFTDNDPSIVILLLVPDTLLLSSGVSHIWTPIPWPWSLPMVYYETLWTLTIFILFYFLFLILYWFCFFFLLDDEEAHDTAVTWQVTWCNIIGLEHDRRIRKIISGYIYTTWWPWVGNEVDMR